MSIQVKWTKKKMIKTVFVDKHLYCVVHLLHDGNATDHVKCKYICTAHTHIHSHLYDKI